MNGRKPECVCRDTAQRQGIVAIVAAIAQLGERQTEDLKVPGSIPGRGIYFFFLLLLIVF